MRTSSLTAALLIIAATPATAKDARIVTPSGQPDMQFLGANVSDVSSKLANRCMDGGLRVVGNSASEVVCEARLDDFSSVMTQAFLGNAYSTSPERYIQFVLLQNDKNVRVQATSWVQLQMALGQTRREPVTSDTMHNALMSFMESAGASYFPGTSFGDRAFLGLVGLEKRAGLYKGKPVVGTYVGDVFVDSPAEKAGILPGDLIVAFQGIPLKKEGFFAVLMSTWKAGKMHKLTIARGEQEIDIPVVAEQRPPITANSAPRQTLRAGAQAALRKPD